MVDSSKGHSAAISTDSIAQDDLYFKNMLSLVHQHTVSLDLPGEDGVDIAQSKIPSPPREEPLKNKKQKKQKKKKLKREHSAENGEADADEYTDLKPKKARLQDTESPGSVAGTPSTAQPAGKPTNRSTVSEKEDSLLLSSIAELDDKRAKLRAKIEELRAKRHANDRDRLERKKMMRRESKMKLKQKRKMEKMMKNKPVVNGDHASKGSNSVVPTSPPKPIYNSEGQIVFSKFDFTASGKKEKKEKSDLTGKDYKRLLQKIEKRNEKINKVKSKDESAAKSLQDKFKWESALHKAEGVKVKDNPELIKKALKRKEKIKQHRKKKWDARVETVKKQQNEKIKKRTENIQKRKQANKDKKMQKAKKKGRLLPGF
ncbi:surfeit locus protein 6 homolog isoform X2 [Dreissena polymorpha]|uniref:Ribosomal RNA-processing protein 14/surfeit locus protein 6 C-terminal domain-containing protein n=2 Tax=Dreissena polymorpha TaxID=45954 RepID=A0A9D4FPG0_DREPO|nr:surfeit locus protein 6 homolog isoform X2 [Dreissena polymorpha]KAH3800908.1 hypothetical protein DPMN_154551 [Dreissena polymorpha]